MDEHLPTLHMLRQANRRIDLVLVTAVRMHLDLEQPEAAMAALADLATVGGRVFMALAKDRLQKDVRGLRR